MSFFAAVLYLVILIALCALAGAVLGLIPFFVGKYGGKPNLGVLGYTEHAQGHAMKAADTAAMILTVLGYGEREIELARIAGFMHDIGNCVNRIFSA